MAKRPLDPVHAAVVRHSVSDVLQAIEQGSSVDARDHEDRTPLFYAVGDGDTAMTAELLRRGASPNAQDKNLETPLHFAAREFRPELAKLLMEHGAAVDVPDAHGNTALFRAVFDSRGRGEVIELLLSHSADRNRKNDYEMSPIDLARSIANYDVAQFFRE